ncbi:hypothetical protein ACPA9J_21990 [Pseudomonas aeruginosa]
MSLHVLAYNLKRLVNIFGVAGAMEALRGLEACHFPAALHKLP